MGRQDFYGEGLAERTRDVLEEKGATVSEFVLYAADAQNFTAEVNKVAASKPDAIVLVSFNETTKIIPQLIAKGIGPQDVQIYFVDGNLADYSDENFDLTGVKGTAPALRDAGRGVRGTALQGRPDGQGPDLRPGELRRRRSSPRSRRSRPATTPVRRSAPKHRRRHPGGHASAPRSRSARRCSRTARTSTTTGKSGPADMTDSGSLIAGTYGINEYAKGNTYEQIDTVSGVVPATE